MNTLDDLRSTLENHSHDASGLDPLSRRNQLGERIAAARRRRNAVRGGVAVAAVVAVAAAVALPQVGSDDVDTTVASRTMLGDVAPETMTALGLTYEFEDHTSTEDGTAVTLEPVQDGAQPPLLTWTTLADDALVTITAEESDDVLWSSRAGGFSDHVVLDQWAAGPITVSSTEPGVGAALYEFDEDSAIEGVSAHGVTFRQEVANRTLIAGRVSDRGATSLEVSYDLPDTHGGEVTLASHCSGRSAEDVAVAVLLDGEVITVSEGCTDNVGLTGQSHVTFRPSASQRSGTLETRLVRSVDDMRPVTGEHADVVLGVALYEPAISANFNGILSDRWLEHSGHLWKLEDDVRGEATETLVVDLWGDKPHLVRGMVAGRIDYDRIDRDVLRIQVGGEPMEVTPTHSKHGAYGPPLWAADDAGVASLLPTSAQGATGASLVSYSLVE